jgi:hypothetical protein
MTAGSASVWLESATNGVPLGLDYLQYQTGSGDALRTTFNDFRTATAVSIANYTDAPVSAWSSAPVSGKTRLLDFFDPAKMMRHTFLPLSLRGSV